MEETKASSGDSSADDEPSKGPSTERSQGRRRAAKRSIPALLPPEFLDSSSEDEDESKAAPAAPSKPKRIKFNTVERQLGSQGKLPQDRRVGRTLYRVLAAHGEQPVAPIMSKHSRNMKQELMARRRAPSRQGGGFFVRGR